MVCTKVNRGLTFVRHERFSSEGTEPAGLGWPLRRRTGSKRLLHDGSSRPIGLFTSPSSQVSGDRVGRGLRRQLMEAKRRKQAEDATRDPLGDVCEGMFGGDGVLFRAAEEGPFSGERHDPAGAAASDIWT